MAHFFFGAAVWGRLRLRDIPDRGPWDPARITYWDEAYLDGISRLALTGQKVGSVAELDEAIATSRRTPGIRMLWIHEDLLGEAQRRWEDTWWMVAGRGRVRASAFGAAAVAAALFVGLIGIRQAPESPPTLPQPKREAARATTPLQGPLESTLATATAQSTVRLAGAFHSPAATPQTARRLRPKVGYAVSVGTFANSTAADRMKHLVMSKGYVVVVVPRGAASQVVTPPYPTRAQAERVMRGLEGSGVPASVTPWGAL